MNAKQRQVYEARARIAKALAHPTRLLLLDLLRQRERCVGDLTRLVDADQSTVSKHLAVLREVGLVAGRRDGSAVRYRVTCACLEGFFSCIESVMKENLKVQTETVEGCRQRGAGARFARTRAGGRSET